MAADPPFWTATESLAEPSWPASERDHLWALGIAEQRHAEMARQSGLSGSSA